MPEDSLQPCAYHVLRYNPNLLRDEWVNIGVLIHDPKNGRARARFIEEEAEFARVRRLHAGADLALLRSLAADFEAQFEGQQAGLAEFFRKLEETLSNALQLSPQKGVLTEDLDAELDRLYRDHVEPPVYRRTVAELLASRSGIRARARDVFRRAGLLRKMEQHFRVEEFTYPGDTLRLDFAYRANGTRGFAHALTLAGGATQAKVLAFTAEAIRSKLEHTAFAALTEAPPWTGDRQHQFITRLLEDQGIELVSANRIESFASRIKPAMH